MEPPTELDMKRDARRDMQMATNYGLSSSVYRAYCIFALHSWIRRAVHSESKVEELEARVKELEELIDQAMPYGRYDD
jgi:hypothetical protein